MKKTNDRTIRAVDSARYWQSQYGLNEEYIDDQTSGQLLDAVAVLAELTKRQEQTRDTGVLPHNDPYYAAHMPTGGLNEGYRYNDDIVNNAKKAWPLEPRTFTGGVPRSNIMAAIGLLVAEYERLERMDRALVGYKKKKKRVKRPKELDVYESAASDLMPIVAINVPLTGYTNYVNKVGKNAGASGGP